MLLPLQAGHHNHILLIPKCHLWGTQSAPSPKCLGHHQYHPAHHWVCHWYLIVRSGVVQTVIPHTNNFNGGKIVLQWLTFTMATFNKDTQLWQASHGTICIIHNLTKDSNRRQSSQNSKVNRCLGMSSSFQNTPFSMKGEPFPQFPARIYC